MAFRQLSFKTSDDLARVVTSGKHVTAAAVDDGGADYSVNDILTVVGGDICEGQAATLKVTGETGGVIDSVSVLTDGVYFTAPTNPVSVTGGTGSGATFNLTTAALISGAAVMVKTLRHKERWYQFWYA